MASIAYTHPLPTIHDAAIYERIFLHRSLGRAPVQSADGTFEDDDNDKLAFLGDQVIQMCVTEVLFRRCPGDKTSALSPRKSYLVSKQKLAEWSDEYELPTRIRGPEHQLLTIQTNKLQRAQVFQAYIAAYFLEKGYLETKAWLKPVIDATYDEMLQNTEEYEVQQELDDVTEPPFSPPQSTGMHTPVSSPRRNRTPSLGMSPGMTPINMRSPASSGMSSTSTRSPGPASPPSKPLINSLSIFNEKCSQNNLEATWTELTEGPAHQRTFTMTLKIQGHRGVLGKGQATSKKQAQQLAAEEALKKLPQIIASRP